MQDVAVIEDAAAAEVSLDPIRSRMLAELAEPHTATTLAARLGLARQTVNYHVKTLEQHGLVELVEERRKGNMTERVVRASAAAYVISPAALAAWLVAQGITLSFLPTPLAEAVLADPWPAGGALRAMLTGGDRLQRRPPPGAGQHVGGIGPLLDRPGEPRQPGHLRVGDVREQPVRHRLVHRQVRPAEEGHDGRGRRSQHPFPLHHEQFFAGNGQRPLPFPPPGGGSGRVEQRPERARGGQ